MALATLLHIYNLRTRKKKRAKLETCRHVGVGMGFFYILLESSSLAILSMCSTMKEK